MDGGFLHFEMEKAGEVNVCGGKIHLLEIQESSEVGRWASWTSVVSLELRCNRQMFNRTYVEKTIKAIVYVNQEYTVEK